MASSQQATTAASARLTTSEEGFELAISLRSALDRSPTNTCWATNFPYVKTTDPPESWACLMEVWNNISWETSALAPKKTKLRVTFQKSTLCIEDKCSNWSSSDTCYTVKTEQKLQKAAISSSHFCHLPCTNWHRDLCISGPQTLYCSAVFI